MIRGKVAIFLKRQIANLLASLASLEMLQPVVVLAICLLLLLRFVPLGQSGDGILSTIMSLQRLTVYYWGQDRFGNLLPLLTAWIRNPAWNAEAQIVLRLLAGLMAPLFFCALAFRRPAEMWRATIMSDCLLLITAGPSLLHEIFVEASPYGTSLACAGLASLALRVPARGRANAARLGLGLVALLAAYVVNYGLIILTLPLIGLFALIRPSVRLTRLLVLHLVAATLAFMLPGIATPGLSRTSLGVRISVEHLLRYAAVIWDAAGWMFVLAVLLPPLALLLHAWRRSSKPVARLALATVAPFVAVAILSFAVIASSQWVAMNAFHFRYFVPGYLLLISLGGLALWGMVRLALRNPLVRGGVFVGLAALLLVASAQRLHRLGSPDRELVGNGKTETARAVAAQVVSRSLDGIAGDYWEVWPAVFVAEQFHYDSGYRGPDVFGVSYRGEPMRAAFASRLASQGHVRLACLDLVPEECLQRTISVMGMPGLRVSQISVTEPMPKGHLLGFVDITPAKTPLPRQGPAAD